MARRFFYVSVGLLCFAVAYHLGAKSAGAQGGMSASQEVAVLTGQAADGETIPLPHYGDGTEALESECRWMASVAYASVDPNTSGNITRFECFTEGRVVRAFCCPQPNCLGPGPLPARANYLIVAVRSTSPTATRQSTFGNVKARYRGERGAALPGPVGR